ncbi:MAG: 4-hydroxythreonine-4-phosphate dehydrogenase PdxA [Bacteroidales bacterium]|nr:4-hydroxythreonine-4-phosphate dehydrogenase PdxA [Bacteroidales bacterium]
MPATPTHATRPRIAVTMGDPAGVGPELCLRLLAEEPLHEVAIPIVFGDVSVLAAVAERLRLPMPRNVENRETFSQNAHAIRTATILDFQQIRPTDFTPGQVSAAAGRAAFAYISAAIAAARAGQVDAVCTAPIHKEALAAAGVPFPGHTEMFTTLTGAARSCMMLTAPEITCSLVTAHVGYRDVPQLLSIETILDAIELTDAAMTRMRGRKPRLTICGLNPHAGERGLFGDREEERFIIPAVERARQKGITIDGPFPPDTAFLARRRATTDAYICMYHDQGLIPLKALAFDEGINVTLGLPIVRTSVDHGTAFDIAWQGLANPASLYAAFRLAAQLIPGSPNG